ncbi:MAG: hypothetical protein DSZ24_02270 [Thermodesulfatator sp.]|nr:MAG: hypothetical protein DSZ24_02270 [Thermodesulfatator sp.]
MKAPKRKGGFLLWLLVAGLVWGFSWPRWELSPYARYQLSRLPLVGRFITPPSPPEKAYLETEKLVKRLEEVRADRYAPDLYAEVQKKWKRAQAFYNTGHYDWAKEYFQKTQELARKALEKSRKVLQKKKQKAYQELQELRQRFEAQRENFPLQKRVQITLALWRLELLIRLERFEEFQKDLQDFRKIYPLTPLNGTSEKISFSWGVSALNPRLPRVRPL